jgi:hypothetical protein
VVDLQGSTLRVPVGGCPRLLVTGVAVRLSNGELQLPQGTSVCVSSGGVLELINMKISGMGQLFSAIMGATGAGSRLRLQQCQVKVIASDINGSPVLFAATPYMWRRAQAQCSMTAPCRLSHQSHVQSM